MRKKKLVLISESLGGGLRKHICQLLEHLDKEKFEIFLIHGTDNVDEVFEESKDRFKRNCHFISCDSLVRDISPFKDLRSYFFIKNQIKLIEPDIVHCHSSKAGAIGRVAAKRRKVPSVFYTPHAYSFLSKEIGKYKKRIYILIERILSRAYTTKTFTVSKGELDEALNENIDKKEKFTVIYNAIENTGFISKEECRKRLGLPPDAFVIGNLARLEFQKDPMLFLKSIEPIENTCKKSTFVWIGDGNLKNEVMHQITAMGLENKVYLLGFRKNADVLVGAFDVFLSTSHYEGLPYALIESIRAGVPIVATNVVGNNEIVQEGKNGYLFDNQDMNDLGLIVKSASELNSSSIKKNYNSRFSVDKMISKISLMYNNGQ